MIKSERVVVDDIKVGDTILHWDRTVKVERVTAVSSGYIFDTDSSKFMRRNGETVVRFVNGGLNVQITKVPGCEDLPLPKYAKPGDAGMDLLAAEDVVIGPGCRVLVSTGFRVAIPEGYEMQVRSRSGLALKHGVTVLNSPGTVDSSYRGIVGVILCNTDRFTEFKVSRGDRIAQAVVAPVSHVEWDEVAELDETERNGSGFGSTGVSNS